MTRFNPYQIQQILERTPWKSNFVPSIDRNWWEALRQSTDPEHVNVLIADAEQALTEPPAFLPASLYLAFRETGDRKQYEALMHSREQAIAALALAECFVGQGRYLTALQDYIWAMCEQSTWSYPAHLADLPDPTNPYIDLGVAMTALALSDVYLLLGSQFDDGVVRRLRQELDTRVWTPYLARQDFHWQGNWLERGVSNWTAVCTAGVLGSAINMNLESEKLSRLVDRGLRSLDEYLETFDPDGGSSEGPGYWGYGFGYFSIIAKLLAQRTDGRIDLFDRPQVREIAQFPIRTQLSYGHYVSFSDCSLDVEMEPALLDLLAERLELPELLELKPTKTEPRSKMRGLTWPLRELTSAAHPIVPDRTELPDHTWFRGLNWMISRDRDSRLVMAIKGGHNNELHNQNDVGSLIVHVDGESLVTDPGYGKATRQYFGPERYDYLVNNSRGHSVPVVDGHEQPVGREAAATVLTHTHGEERDVLLLDMKAAYPVEAGLASLQREAMLDRRTHSVSLTDSFAFTSHPAKFESVLITLANVEVSDGSVIIRGKRNAIRTRFDQTKVAFRLDVVPDVELDSGVVEVRRLIFSPATLLQSGSIHLNIEKVI